MLKRIVVLIFFTLVGVIYLHNLTRDVYSGDIGDLVTAAYVGGVAHPPGYPLFSLMGFIFSRLPIPFEVVTKIALISTIAAIFGLIFFYKFSLQTIRSIFISILSTSILAFSYFYWVNAELPEVFALNNFFAILLLYLAINFYRKPDLKNLFLMSFFTGLSLTHHHTIVLLFPTIFILTLKHIKIIFRKKETVIKITLFFILGFSIYSYVFLAASKNPPINWDNPVNLKNFIHLILRRDYSYAPSFTHQVPIKIIGIVVGNYFKTLISTFSYQIIFIFLLGAIYLIKKDKLIFISLFAAYFLSGPFLVFYGAGPSTTAPGLGVIERMYSLSFVVAMFFAPYGFLLIKEILNGFFSRYSSAPIFSKKVYTFILLSYFFIVPIFQLIYNYPKADLSKTKVGNTLASNILNSLPKKSVLFVSGDTTTFNVWYLYYVLGVRGDIDIINPPGVGGNKYLDEEINIFYKKNPKSALNDVIPKTIDKIREKRKIFTTYQIDPMPKNTVLVPKGLVFEVMDKKEIPEKADYLTEVEKIIKKIKIKRRLDLTLAEQNFTAAEIPSIYSNALVRTGDFLDDFYKDSRKSEHYYRRALWIDDTNPQAYSGLALSLFKGYGDCGWSIDSLKKAIELYPIWKRYYLQLYTLYNKCEAGKKTIQKFKDDYEDLFNEDIETLTRPRVPLDTDKKN
ncbi:hypothetical protein A3F58_00745 [Candidatus Roizmanbacteria bacterium RIFCSPHIGHO2_12_FULL_37_9b]|nr:MAG: hypothetical protein A3F58_00745 [Candidatus Roizmanbacteria bacterium RIFCSPHIGHO2_12_FULL_37_9b]